MSEDTQPHLITYPDEPGLLNFLHETLKNGHLGYEAN